MRVDFSEIRNVLAAVDRLLNEHQGQYVPTPAMRGGAGRPGDRASAVLTEDLLAVQDYLRLADAELSAIYWMTQGRQDPRAKGSGLASQRSRLRDSNSLVGTAPRMLSDTRPAAQPAPTPALTKPVRPAEPLEPMLPAMEAAV